MTMMGKRLALMLAVLCALAAIVPAAAVARGGAEDEYNLDLPGSGANGDTPSSTSNVSDSSDSGGFPVVVVVLVAGAGLAAGVAAWRMRQPREPDGPA